MTLVRYPERLKQNILPLSKSPLIHIAIGEWAFANSVIDAGNRTKCCELCDQERLRYQFLIKNGVNNNEMWVGSSCILKFGVAVMHGGKALYGDQAKHVLEAQLQSKRKEISLEALSTLLTKPNVNLKLVDGVKEFTEKGRALSPKQISYVAWQLGKHGLNHDLAYFRMDLMKKKYQEDFASLQDWQITQIWPALKPGQKKVAENNGYIAPK